MAVAWILLFRLIRSGGAFFDKVLLPVSQASYGMYLCHMLILGLISAWLRSALGLGADGSLGIWTTPVQIVCTALLSLCASALFCVLVRKIPKVGKWIIG